MMDAKEEPSCGTGQQAIDLLSAILELSQLSSQELNNRLKDSEYITLQNLTETGSPTQINVETFAKFLHVHLMAVVIGSITNAALFRYLLRGLRLLHSLHDHASRQTKFEKLQILLDQPALCVEVMDLVTLSLIVRSNYLQESHASSPAPLLHSALVASCLYLLTQVCPPQWHEIAQAVVEMRKGDLFMEAAFRAVCMDIKSLQIKLSSQSPIMEKIVNYLCQQCEASIQFLHSLCQQKMFRERLLRNKELCGKGGVLLLAEAILKLNISPLLQESLTVVASVSRLKSKVLSILLHLCEAESISYLDEVASSPSSLDLAKSVALEVLWLLKSAFNRDSRHFRACSGRTHPKGLLLLNAMRLADILSDDSNFRSLMTVHSTDILAAIFSFPHGEFLSSWCSSDLPIREEEATLEYDAVGAVGWILDSFSSLNLQNAENLEPTFVLNSMPQASYARQRTSLLVKVIANLHCYVPKICKEHEKNLFLHKFLECLQKNSPKSSPGFLFASDAQKADTVYKNLCSLLGHAESLIPNYLNEDDVQLLRVFCNQIKSTIIPEDFELSRLQESKFEGIVSWDKFSNLNISDHHRVAQTTGGCILPQLIKAAPNFNTITSNLKEGMSDNSVLQEVDQHSIRSNHVNPAEDVMMNQDRREGNGIVGIEISSGSDSSSLGGKNTIDLVDEFSKHSEHITESGSRGIQEDGKVQTVGSEEKQHRKRKRTIMNDDQITVIERAILDEPGMQRNTAWVQSWADKLSEHGSEVTSSQLKNWLNNRKARMARAKFMNNRDVRVVSEGDNHFQDKQGGSLVGSFYDSPESNGEDHNVPPNARGTQSTSRTGTSGNSDTAPLAENFQCEPGQYVVLVDDQGEEIGKAKVHQTHGKWCGLSLEEARTIVVDVIEIKVDKWVRLPNPSDVASQTGAGQTATSEVMGSSSTTTMFDEADTKNSVMRVIWQSNKILMPRPRHQ